MGVGVEYLDGGDGEDGVVDEGGGCGGLGRYSANFSDYRETRALGMKGDVGDARRLLWEEKLGPQRKCASLNDEI